jgi:F0F1-type ATP synthase assembly protein I
MDRPPEDDRSTVAIAMAWASRIIALSASMVVPALIGAWIDQQLNTKVVFLLLGMALGIAAAVVQLMRIVKESNSQSQSRSNKPPTS